MRIIAHSYINSSKICVNGEIVLQKKESEENFLKEIYLKLELNYPKFYKMDNLSKMAILTEQLIHEFIPKQIDQENKLQVVFANRTSSGLTDGKFLSSYHEKNNPSPSLFVYTLPNILIGELAIKNKWYGEGIFFIEKEFNPDFFILQSKMAFQRNNELCLCGWVEATDENNQECFLFLTENTGNDLNTENLNNILTTYRNE